MIIGVTQIPTITKIPITPTAFFNIPAHPITASVASPKIFPTTGITVDTAAFVVFAVTPSTVSVILPSSDNTVTNNIVEDTLASLEENTTIIEPVKEDMVIETDTPKVEKVNKKSEKNSSQEVLITPVSPEISVAQETTINKPKENSIPNLNDKPIEDTQTQVETIPTEEYRYNDSMTQTIVNIINNNPSSYMLQDGYTVLIDSSIVTLTNQFTFTEQRVINKISQKAGTIRVYAQDYYFNGEFLFTECYIY